MTLGDIVHPIFLQSSQHSVDKFWEKIFEELAYGITPYGVYSTNTTINCKTKTGAMASVFIDTVDPKATHDAVYDMFYNILGIMSPAERINKLNVIKNTNEENTTIVETWSDIKKKNTKELLIEIFVIQSKNKYKLAMKQARFLSSVIFMSLSFKTINSDDIHLENGLIKSIDGINLSKTKIHLDIDLYNIDKNDISTNDNSKNNMYEKWEKYITDLYKKK